MRTHPSLKTFRTIFAVGALALLLASAALPSGLAADTSATTTNSTPSVDAVYFYTSDPTSGSAATCKSTGRATSFDPVAGDVRTVYVCVEASDPNGYNDLCDEGETSASDLRRFSVTDAAGASISDVSHDKTNVDLACATGSGTGVALIGSFEMEYWRPAGLASSSSAYIAEIEITDILAAAASANETFDYTALTSLDASEVTSISLGGALAPGAIGSDATANIYNKGNTVFTIYVAGANLTGSSRSQSVDVANLKWATSASVEYGTKTALGATGASTGLEAPAETADGTTARSLYFQLGAPSGTNQWIPADTYAGTVTFATG